MGDQTGFKLYNGSGSKIRFAVSGGPNDMDKYCDIGPGEWGLLTTPLGGSYEIFVGVDNNMIDFQSQVLAELPTILHFDGKAMRKLTD